ncbi:MAG: adenylosuccinate synthase [Anaerolineae bacterium]|jgi:adenylosuccinate synthase|nr:adenylosuccinate synthase [Anaerolineae bacterium]
MPVTIVVGAQWGDEGKGRVVDDLASRANVVARYNGGDNAGHTIVAEGHTLGLHLVPSGILNPQAICLIGGGTVINPLRLLEEIATLRNAGIEVTPERLKIAAGAHLILPTHRALDGAQELTLGEQAIGTTARGIGPTYADKARRVGLRAALLRDPDTFATQARTLIITHNERLINLFQLKPQLVGPQVEQLRDAAAQLTPYLVDGAAFITDALAENKEILCEGAQGTLLDLDHGTYPFVTSSSPIAGGALTGLGFGPKEVTRVVGVAKAYTTRVGAGAFPTELLDATGDRLRDIGHEYGVTTGRPRRCGWLDTVILRYAAQVNGLTEIALTKLDVLSGIPTLKIAVAYEINGAITPHFPAEWGNEIIAAAKPIYEELPGWEADLRAIRRREDLPTEAQAYVARIEALVATRISFIGVGPERESLILP